MDTKDITKGEFKITYNEHPASIAKGVRYSGGYIAFLPEPHHYQGQDQRYKDELIEHQANAELICEAFNVANETGLSPIQLKQRIEEFEGKNNIESLFKQHILFTENQFPDSTWKSSLRGLEREIKEVEEAKLNYSVIDGKDNKRLLGLEYIDCFMYLLDSMNRSGVDVSEFSNLFLEKLHINLKREWKQNKDKSYSHIKTSFNNKQEIRTVCSYFEASTSTSSATICIHCGREKLEHLNIEK